MIDKILNFYADFPAAIVIIWIIIIVMSIAFYLFVWNCSTSTEETTKLLKEIIQQQNDAIHMQQITNEELIKQLKEINNKLNQNQS